MALADPSNQEEKSWWVFGAWLGRLDFPLKIRTGSAIRNVSLCVQLGRPIYEKELAKSEKVLVMFAKCLLL